MTGCYTCGGGMGKHDPVAHGYPGTDGESVPGYPGEDADDEPCMCGTDFTCMATEHYRPDES